MDLQGLRTRHIQLIAWTHIRYSMRGGTGLVFVFLALVAGLGIAGAIMDPLTLIEKEMDQPAQQMMDQVIDTVGRPVIAWVVDDDQEQASYLISEQPALVSVFLLILVIGLPFLVGLGSFNQLSGDIGSRGIRYLLLRTERVNLFLGRFIGTYLFSLAVYGLVMAVVLIYLLIKVHFYPPGELILWMGRGFLAVCLLSMPYTALCAWISAGVDSPFGSLGSLVFNQLIIGFWPLLVSMAKRAWEHASYLHYLMPWGYKYWLLHPSPVLFLICVAVMLAFTVVFLVLGLRHFQKRDL
jgi:hypothetical protein